jgi:hypothetical protein
MKLIIVYVEDYSGLGGPMGSEHTEHIATKICSTMPKAIIWAEKYIKNNGGTGRLPDNWKTLSQTKKIQILADTGPWGFSFSKQEVD